MSEPSIMIILLSNAGVVDNDYVSVSGQVIQFSAGDVIKFHTILVNDDIECEKDPNENLFSNIAVHSGIPDISVTVPRATVTTDDTDEPECGKLNSPYKIVPYTHIDKLTVALIIANAMYSLTDVYPVERFMGNVSVSGTSFMFTWRLLSIGVSITSGYNLTCLPQLTGIPAPQPLILSKTTTSANETGLYSGVSYNCSIITLTTEGPSVSRNTTLTTPEKG